MFRKTVDAIPPEHRYFVGNAVENCGRTDMKGMRNAVMKSENAAKKYFKYTDRICNEACANIRKAFSSFDIELIQKKNKANPEQLNTIDRAILETYNSMMATVFQCRRNTEKNFKNEAFQKTIIISKMKMPEIKNYARNEIFNLADAERVGAMVK